jgi:hypothetical protein
MSWEYDIAKEFKKRNNLTPLGPILGKVINKSPALKISIHDGQVFLENEQLYIADSLQGALFENDEVLLIPTSSEQIYFIIGKVVKL